MRSYSRRVAYAVLALKRNEESRAFDTCFEQYDGALVVTAIMRRAKDDIELLDAIRRRFRSAGLAPWQATAARFGNIRDQDLPRAALDMQRQAAPPRPHPSSEQLSLSI